MVRKRKTRSTDELPGTRSVKRKKVEDQRETTVKADPKSKRALIQKGTTTTSTKRKSKPEFKKEKSGCLCKSDGIDSEAAVLKKQRVSDNFNTLKNNDTNNSSDKKTSGGSTCKKQKVSKKSARKSGREKIPKRNKKEKCQDVDDSCIAAETVATCDTISSKIKHEKLEDKIPLKQRGPRRKKRNSTTPKVTTTESTENIKAKLDEQHDATSMVNEWVKKVKPENVDSSGNESEEDIDWEDVQEAEGHNGLDDNSCFNSSIACRSTTTKTENRNVEISIEIPGMKGKRKKKAEDDLMTKIKKAMARFKKQVQLDMHKVHLITLVSWGFNRNAICNEPILQAFCLSHVPSHFAKISVKKWQSVELTNFLTWFKEGFPSHEQLRDTLQNEMIPATSCPQNMAEVLVIILRSMGLLTRLVSSLQPVSMKKSAESKKSSKKSKHSSNSIDQESTETTPRGKSSKMLQSGDNLDTIVSAQCKQSENIETNIANSSELSVSPSKHLSSPSSSSQSRILKSAEKKSKESPSKQSSSSSSPSQSKVLKSVKTSKESPSKQLSSSPSSSPSQSKVLKSVKTSKESPSKQLSSSPSSSSQSKVSVEKSSKEKKTASATSQAGSKKQQSKTEEEDTESGSKGKKLRKQKKVNYAMNDGSDSENEDEQSSHSEEKNSEESDEEFEKEKKYKAPKMKIITSKKKKQKTSSTAKAKKSPSVVEMIDDDDEFDITSQPVIRRRFRKDKSPVQILSDDSDGSMSNGTMKKNRTDAWVEVYLPADKSWMCVDLLSYSVNQPEVCEKHASRPMSYVIAYDNENSVKDVTGRYASDWLSKTKKLRIDPDWWEETLLPYKTRRKKMDEKEDSQLLEQHQEKPLPQSITEYKGHPLYVLKRHLLKFEAIYPESATTLGFIRGEAVYSRDCVHLLHTREKWMSLEGRVVKQGEEPYKIVKGRMKKNQPVVDPSTVTIDLFGRWQTEDYIPPPVKDGKVPKNEYGNVELFKPSMLPPGSKHIQIPGIQKIAKKLGIDGAAAVVGFDFHCGFCHPVIDGLVVCEESVPALMDAWRQEQEEAKRKKEEKREKRVLGYWKLFVRSLLIRERLKRKYETQESRTSSEQSSEQLEDVNVSNIAVSWPQNMKQGKTSVKDDGHCHVFPKRLHKKDKVNGEWTKSCSCGFTLPLDK